MNEKAITKKILTYLTTLPACFRWKEHGGMYGHAGLPDIVCCIAGRFVAFEVKAAGGKLTELQEDTLCRIRDAGGVAHMVRSLDEVKSILQNLEGIS